MEGSICGLLPFPNRGLLLSSSRGQYLHNLAPEGGFDG